MKRYSILLCTLLVAGSLWGQQRMQYSQYLQNAYLVNPAVGGAENYLDIRSGFVQQWTGFQGAPRAVYLSLNKGLYEQYIMGESFRVTSLPVPGRGNAAQTSTIDRVKRLYGEGPGPDFHLGLGGALFSEKTGPISYNGLSLGFSGHVRVVKNTRLAVGANAELLNYRVDPSDILLLDPTDVAVNGSVTNLFLPGVNAGFTLYNKHWFIGGATRQLLKNRIQVNQINPYDSRLDIHYVGQAGLRIPLNEQVRLVPSAAYRFVEGAPASLGMNLMAEYKQFFYVGMGYRPGDAVIGMLGFPVWEKLQINYAYDLTISNLSNYSSGSHSIVLALRLMTKESGERRYFW